ncbi:hypothetical protein ISCGN_019134 [Ixodes scapularis]
MSCGNPLTRKHTCSPMRRWMNLRMLFARERSGLKRTSSPTLQRLTLQMLKAAYFPTPSWVLPSSGECALRICVLPKQKTRLIHSAWSQFLFTNGGTHLAWFMMETEQGIALQRTETQFATQTMATRWHLLQTEGGMENGLSVPWNTYVGLLGL